MLLYAKYGSIIFGENSILSNWRFKLFKRGLIYIISTIILTGCSHTKANEAFVSGNNVEKKGMIQQLKSNHFTFYSKDEDKDCLEELLRTLEQNFTRITEDLKVSLDKKVEVYIYSDLNTYHEAINQPEAPSWVVGNANPIERTIQMVNPSKADGRPYSEFMKVIVHEFAHVVTREINSDVSSLPVWLSEGIAVFEAEQNNGIEEVITKAKESDKFPTLSDFETDSYTFGNNGGYQFSYYLVEYIVKLYGYEKLIELIKAPLKFENILGVSKEEFEKQWISYLN